MITIQTKFAQYPQSMCEYHASKDGRYGWLLCTSHAEDSHALEEIQAEIKLEILNSNVLEVSRMEIEKWLREFFADYHWKLHASFRKAELKEKGISLLFAVIYEADIYLVQFGRIFCAQTSARKLNPVGKNWKNYHVQSLVDLGLFGLSEEDIKVRITHLELPENESLIVLPGSIAGRVFESGTEVGSLLPLVESFNAARNALGIVLKHTPNLMNKKRRWENKLLISSILLLVATFLAILYMAGGNRWIDQWLHKKQKDIKTTTREFLASAVKPREITLQNWWSLDIGREVTARPVFNKDYIYLANKSVLLIYTLRDKKLFSEIPLEAVITALLPTESGLEVFLDNQQVLGLDKKGQTLWSKEISGLRPDDSTIEAMEINNDKDKRLDQGIVIAPSLRNLIVLESQTGREWTNLALDSDLSYLSDFDDYNQCLYAIVANELICVKLKIVY